MASLNLHLLLQTVLAGGQISELGDEAGQCPHDELHGQTEDLAMGARSKFGGCVCEL